MYVGKDTVIITDLLISFLKFNTSVLLRSRVRMAEERIFEDRCPLRQGTDILYHFLLYGRFLLSDPVHGDAGGCGSSPYLRKYMTSYARRTEMFLLK